MKKYFSLIIVLSLLAGCKKFLDEKPDVKLALPNTLIALQGMMDNDATMNALTGLPGEVSSDNYYVADATLAALSSQALRNAYTWGDDITLTESPNHWSTPYNVVTICNVVLENIENITPEAKDQASWNNIKGSALAFRAKSFLGVISAWTKAYSESNGTSDMGIPIRLSSDYNIVSVRANLKDSYNQVISDLKQAIPLLPVSPVHVMRPSKGSVYGLLARTYLFMGAYDSAALYADRCISTSGKLINYNSLNVATAFPFVLYNDEVLWHTNVLIPSILTINRAIVDTALYASYQSNDLRKLLFFQDLGNGKFYFRGNYTQGGTPFTGVGLDEIWLIKSECLARLGSITDAMDALNKLMILRWKTGTFTPFKASDKLSALQVILPERRKELLFRDLRWMDLKRLNKESAFQQSIYRKVNGQTYELPPNDNRYALPIPSSVIVLSGMPQNPR